MWGESHEREEVSTIQEKSGLLTIRLGLKSVALAARQLKVNAAALGPRMQMDMHRAVAVAPQLVPNLALSAKHLVISLKMQPLCGYRIAMSKAHL